MKTNYLKDEYNCPYFTICEHHKMDCKSPLVNCGRYMFFEGNLKDSLRDVFKKKLENLIK